MKETKIAKENVKWLKVGNLFGRPNSVNVEKAEEHKQTCQRWLGFLEQLEYNFTEESESGLINKQLDLKQAIKLYKDAGI